MNKCSYLVSALVSALFLCIGANFAYAENSLSLYGTTDISSFSSFKLPSNYKQVFLTSTQPTQASSIKLAQVCWILDTGECLGNAFSYSDEVPGEVPPDSYGPKDDNDCIKEGYTLTSCPPGTTPNKFCIYDNRYFAECISDCPEGYKICEEPYYGVGEECNGMYKECQCDKCEGYNYTADNIPEGYIIDGSPCNSCDGPKYRIKVNPCNGFLDCGELGPKEGAQVCISGTKKLYSDCKECPNSCSLSDCLENATCTYEECSGKYCFLGCASGYSYKNGACVKTETCTADNCSGYTLTSQTDSNATYASCTIKNADCSNGATKYKKTGCKPGYHESGGKCVQDCAVETCSGYTLTSQTDNNATYASCTIKNADCSTGTTKYKKTGCKSGYELVSGTCVKKETCTAETCSGYTLTAQSDSNATYASCTIKNTDCSTGATKYKKTGCKTGYHESGGVCVQDCAVETCSGYTLTSQSDSNATYASCTIKNANCSTGATKYKLTGCKYGYTLKNGACVKPKDVTLTFSFYTCLSEEPYKKPNYLACVWSHPGGSGNQWRAWVNDFKVTLSEPVPYDIKVTAYVYANDYIEMGNDVTNYLSTTVPAAVFTIKANQTSVSSPTLDEKHTFQEMFGSVTTSWVQAVYAYDAVDLENNTNGEYNFTAKWIDVSGTEWQESYF